MAQYRCPMCGNEWDGPPGPTLCRPCNPNEVDGKHIVQPLVIWVNFEEMLERKFK